GAGGAEVADFWILRCPERTRIEAIAAADAQILGVKHDTVVRRVDAIHWAHRRAWGVGAVHTGHGDGTLAWPAVIEGDNATPVDAPGHLVLVLPRRDTGIALDPTVAVPQ